MDARYNYEGTGTGSARIAVPYAVYDAEAS